MENAAVINEKINLATLCLRLCEEIEEHYAGSGYELKPMPKDEAFEKEILIREDIYHVLYAAVCGLIDAFHKSSNEIVVSTYRLGIIIIGLKIAGDDLFDLCAVENDKYSIQRSRLGITVAFLKQEQVEIKPVCGDKGGICFVFPNENSVGV